MQKYPEQIADVTDASLSGERVLVTGSTSGIGREAAKAFSRLGAEHVIIHGRNVSRGKEVVEELSGDGEFVRADFSSFEDIEAVEEAVNGELDILVNNAGGYFTDTGTTEGVSFTMAVNHFAPFKLTKTVFDVLTSSDRGVVVNVASSAHKGPRLDFEAVQNADWGGFRAYQQSKLANILFTRELARRTSSVDTYAVHPGAIPGSGFARNMPGPTKFLAEAEIVDRLSAVAPYFKTVYDGAGMIMYGALGADEHGKYYAGFEKTRPSKAARNDEDASKLWEMSEDVTDTTFL